MSPTVALSGDAVAPAPPRSLAKGGRRLIARELEAKGFESETSGEQLPSLSDPKPWISSAPFEGFCRRTVTPRNSQETKGSLSAPCTRE